MKTEKEIFGSELIVGDYFEPGSNSSPGIPHPTG